MDNKPEYESDWESELNEILSITPHLKRKTNRRVFYWGSAVLLALFFFVGYVYQANVVALLLSGLKAGLYWIAQYCNAHPRQFY